jgi:hypothetical protein
MLVRLWRKKEYLFIIVRNIKLVQPLWNSLWNYLKELKIVPPYEPVLPLLGE